MSKNPKKSKQKKLKRSLSFYLIIISLLILAIPLTFLGYTGVTSLMARGKPIVGNRFTNDLDPTIKDADLKEITSRVKAMDDVEKASAKLATGTLRVYVQNTTLTDDNLESIGEAVYAVVGDVLSIEEYFTKTGSQKQYDLEIHIFNLDKVTEENESDYVYGIYVKNSNMENPYAQVLTTPLSQEMVQFFIEEEEYNSRPIEEEEEYDVEEEKIEESEGE